MSEQSFAQDLKKRTKEINQLLERFLPEEKGPQKRVLEAMNYSVRVGGKRLRPIFMQEAYALFGGDFENREALDAFMASIEMIHTYSLVHDDLPAMDNDRYRRGNLTTWAEYGETFGILAGDGLLNLAFETASSTLTNAPLANRSGLALQILGKKAGIFGMIGGQTADIEAESKPDELTLENVLFIHEYKTAALIQASLMIGAILAGANQKEVETMEKVGLKIGLAFQIQDDILDVIGDAEELGKPIGSDAENGKQTYVTLVGLEKAKTDVEKLSAEAIELIKQCGADHDFLSWLVQELIHRKK